MGRRTIVVNKQKLQKAINQAEATGPLKNLSALNIKAAEIYNDMAKIPETITVAVVGLRIRQFSLKHVTKAGKRGSGFAAGRPAGPRMKKADKFKASPAAQKVLKALKKHMPDERFKPMIESLENGSRAAAVKLKCIECMGCQPAEVKKCEVFTCSLWLFRPYKEGEALPEDELSVEEAIA